MILYGVIYFLIGWLLVHQPMNVGEFIGKILIALIWPIPIISGAIEAIVGDK